MEIRYSRTSAEDREAVWWIFFFFFLLSNNDVPIMMKNKRSGTRQLYAIDVRAHIVQHSTNYNAFFGNTKTKPGHDSKCRIAFFDCGVE